MFAKHKSNFPRPAFSADFCALHLSSSSELYADQGQISCTLSKQSSFVCSYTAFIPQQIQTRCKSTKVDRCCTKIIPHVCTFVQLFQLKIHRYFYHSYFNGRSVLVSLHIICALCPICLDSPACVLHFVCL